MYSWPLWTAGPFRAGFRKPASIRRGSALHDVLNAVDGCDGPQPDVLVFDVGHFRRDGDHYAVRDEEAAETRAKQAERRHGSSCYGKGRRLWGLERRAVPELLAVPARARVWTDGSILGFGGAFPMRGSADPRIGRAAAKPTDPVHEERRLLAHPASSRDRASRPRAGGRKPGPCQGNTPPPGLRLGLDRRHALRDPVVLLDPRTRP